MTFRLHQAVTVLDRDANTMQAGTIVHVHNETRFEVETDDGVVTASADDLAPYSVWEASCAVYAGLDVLVPDYTTEDIDWFFETDTHKFVEHMKSMDYAKICADRDAELNRVRDEDIISRGLTKELAKRVLAMDYEAIEANARNGVYWEPPGFDEQLAMATMTRMGDNAFDKAILDNLTFECISDEEIAYLEALATNAETNGLDEAGLYAAVLGCYYPNEEQRDRLTNASTTGIDVTDMSSEERVALFTSKWRSRRDDQ